MYLEEINLIKTKKNDIKLRPEDQLILCCARTKVDDETKDKIVSLVSQNLDWDYLISMASRHRLRPLLYVNLNAICAESVPNSILGDLKEFYQNNVHKNLMFTGELVNILQLLGDKSVKPVPYKGPLLALNAYGNLSLREFVDLDILIPRNDAIKTKDTLLKNGYGTHIDIKESHDELYVKTQREYQFYNKKTKMSLEIQWRFTTSHFSTSGDLEYLFDFNSLPRKQINNINYRELQVEDLIIILCIHNASHRWQRLAWLTDVAELIKSNEKIKWSELLTKASAYGIERVILINLLLIQDIFGLEFPLDKLNDKTVKKLSENIFASFFAENENKSFLSQTWLRFKIRENWIMGLKDCLKVALLPTPNEWKEISISPNYYSFYYLFRVLKLGKRF